MTNTEHKRLREGLGLSAGLVEAVSAVTNPVAQQTKAKLAQVKNDVAQKVGAAKIAAAQKKGQQTIQKVQQPKTESVEEARERTRKGFVRGALDSSAPVYKPKVQKPKPTPTKESVEPVEELSREKLTAYAGAARKDLKHAKKHARDYGSSPGDAETARRYQVKRSMGIKKAEDRMAESVDPIVESTSSMLDFYARGHAPARAEDHDPAGVFDAPRPIYEDGGYIAENKFGVYQRGGSIGSKNDKPIKVHDDVQAAKDHAKRLRQTLSKGERGYYKMGYTVRKVKE